MGIIEQISEAIDQVAKAASSAYVYNEQCSAILKVLLELRNKIQSFPATDSNTDSLNSLHTHISNIYNIMSAFESAKWFQKCLEGPVIKPVTDLNEEMSSINEILSQINLPLDNGYEVSTENILADFKSLHGIFADPNRLNDPKIKKKLEEIEKYLQSIGQPLFEDNQKKVKKHKSKHHHHHKKSKGKEQDSEKESDTQSENNEDQTSSADDFNPDDFTDFNNVQKYKLKRTDFTKDSKIEYSNEQYVINKGQMVATKESVSILTFKGDDEETENKFKRLVNVLTAVQHPNLESFIGAVETAPFTVVTRRIGEKLSDILKRAKSRKRKKELKAPAADEDEPYKENKHVTLQPGYRTIITFNIASAMAYLHSLNIIHRDLCCSNITVDKGFNPRIINFANSRFIPDEIGLMSVKTNSTSDFIAPELTDSGSYDESVDVFSFGGILYELITGVAPFSELTARNIQEHIRDAKRPKIPPEVSEDLHNLIDACWSQEPKNRPSFADIVDIMLCNQISFPSDQDTEIVHQFYASKKIKNTDLNGCIDLLKYIAESIGNSFAYLKECIRIRSFLHGYQFLLQTSKYATQEEAQDENVIAQLHYLRRSLEDLLTTINLTETERWSSIALITCATEIPTNMHKFMEQIYVAMVELGFNAFKYDYVNSDLLHDFREAYSLFSDYAEEYQQAVDRMKEIEDFLADRGLDVTITKSEIDEKIKSLFDQFKDYRVQRDDFKLIGSPIGSGMSAIVYKAKQISTNKDVAIKEFREEYLEDEDSMFLLRREVSSLVKLHHEYLVKFVGFNNDAGQPLWVVSELVKGGELFNAIKKKRLTPFQKTKIAFEIAEGMKYLHSKKIIHRDLKTGNVLLDGDTPRITDFGYARTNLSLIMTSKVGTINYMAPEVIEGSLYSYQADVFSYGMMLWELYSGDFPFSWIRHSMVADEILNNTGLPYRMPISQDLKSLIEDSKDFHPENRPTFTEIIQRMLDSKIAFNGSNPKEVEDFYAAKLEKRANEKHDDEVTIPSTLLNSILPF